MAPEMDVVLLGLGPRLPHGVLHCPGEHDALVEGDDVLRPKLGLACGEAGVVLKLRPAEHGKGLGKARATRAKDDVAVLARESAGSDGGAGFPPGPDLVYELGRDDVRGAPVSAVGRRLKDRNVHSARRRRPSCAWRRRPVIAASAPMRPAW